MQPKSILRIIRDTVRALRTAAMLKGIAKRAAEWETLPFSFVMEEKDDAKKEHQLRLLAENRIKIGQYKIFDHNARVITRKKIDGVNCLFIINGEGETIVITPDFEMVLRNAIKG